MASNKVVVLFGPTASGKTSLIQSVFLDRPEPGIAPAFVVSADALQVYRGMDVGTAKPDAAFRARLPHRLIDIREPDEAFSVGDFVALADAACEEALAAGALPIVSGGTGFYLRAFVCGLSAAPPPDPALRAAVARDLAELGPEALRAELQRGDPESAARIEKADHYRLCRALEILRATGLPRSAFAVPERPRDRWDFIAIRLERPRGELYARIDARVDAMFDAGLEAELAALQARGYGPESPGLKAIGYREFFEVVEGEPDRDGRLRALIRRNTRHYAKRQETFFSSLPGALRLDADDEEGFRRILRERLGVRA